MGYTSNPNVTIEHCVYPYDSYWQKLAAALTTMENSGEGPNIINFYSGKFLDFIKQDVLLPFPEDVVSSQNIQDEYCDLVKELAQYNGTYYTLPLGVRCYALFYNKSMLEAAGYTPDDLKNITWDRLYEIAQDLTQWDGDELKVEGITMDKSSRLPHRFMMQLKLNGGAMTSADFKTATLNDEATLKTLDYFIDLYKNKKVGITGFASIDYTAFTTQKAALHIDGSFRAASFNSQNLDFEWGVVELPTDNQGNRSNIGDFWGNSITKYTAGAQLEASKDFLRWLYTDEIMERWTMSTYEIGSKMSILESETIKADPILSVFLAGLKDAYSPIDIQDYSFTAVFGDLFDYAISGDTDAQTALNLVNEKYQQVLDEYWEEIEDIQK